MIADLDGLIARYIGLSTKINSLDAFKELLVIAHYIGLSTLGLLK